MTTPSKAPTLQTVLDGLAGAKGLSPKARRDSQSAIRVFCRELGRQPSDMLVSQIEALGSGLNAARMGVSGRHVNNLRSRVRRAVAATTAEPARRRLDFPLSATWEQLASLLKPALKEAPKFKDKNLVYGDYIVLRCLFRIFQLHGIEPRAVTQASFDRALAYLQETGVSRPHAVYRNMVITWNRLQSLLRPYRT